MIVNRKIKNHKDMKMFNLILVALSMIAIPSVVMADNYFDDDIYYDASKASKKKAKSDGMSVGNQSTVILTQPGDYSIELNYNGSMRDVDEYNRQGAYSYTISDSLYSDSILNVDGYTYTNRIERFYNPDVVSGSGDQELIESYSANQPVVNIYVDSFWDPYPSWSFGYSWSYPYYTGVWNPYWSYYGWYNPWYNPWYWDAYCCHYPYYGYHSHYYPTYYRPSSPGAYRPHRPSSATRASRSGSVGRPGYDRNRTGNYGSSNRAGYTSTRGRGSDIGTSSSSSRPSNMSEGRGAARTTPNRNGINKGGAMEQNKSNSSSKKENVNRPNRSSNRNSSESTRSQSSSNSYSRPSSSSSNNSYSRPSSTSGRSSGGFSGGGIRGGGGSGSRGRR